MVVYTAVPQDRMNKTRFVPAFRRVIFSVLGKQKSQLCEITAAASSRMWSSWVYTVMKIPINRIKCFLGQG